MKIQINWKVALVMGLVSVVAFSALKYESVALTLTQGLAGIITSLGAFAS